jgi:hypothetical protein
VKNAFIWVAAIVKHRLTVNHDIYYIVNERTAVVIVVISSFK